jgi:carbamoyltransferase
MINVQEFWMAFAPSVLSKREPDYLVNPKGIPAPYMILSFDTKERRRGKIQAIHRSDFTARPQVVFKQHSELLLAVETLRGPNG